VRRARRRPQVEAAPAAEGKSGCRTAVTSGMDFDTAPNPHPALRATPLLPGNGTSAAMR